MGSKNKEEKLKQKAAKKKRKSLKKLKKLAKKIAKKSDTTIIQLEIPSSKSNEFKQAANQAILNAISELSESIDPKLSWVDGNKTEKEKALFSETRRRKEKLWKDHGSISTAKSTPSTLPATLPAIDVPYKSPACKRCPALANGLCKCAMKRIPKSA
ncbi:hypothetical protein AB6E04_01980 [Vibrio amylolyticus]|uniref:hypothetical protein n=1 Tax=Vibrio amylolyticus TaxID=2847292 RepID=UPI003550D942